MFKYLHRLIFAFVIIFSFNVFTAEHNTYVHEEYDEINFEIFRMASESMGGFMDAMKSYILYTASQHVPGAVESGVGYYYDHKTRRMERQLFYRIKETEMGMITDRKLDFKCNGKGFFVVMLPGGWPAFTKDGRFELDENGRLVTLTDGFPVLGEKGEIFLPNDNIDVDRQGVIRYNGDIIDVFRIEWYKNRHDLQSFNQVLYYFSKEDYESGTKHGKTDYFISQGQIQQSTITKGYIGLVPEWSNGHNSQTILLKSYSKNLRAAIQQASPMQ